MTAEEREARAERRRAKFLRRMGVFQRLAKRLSGPPRQTKTARGRTAEKRERQRAAVRLATHGNPNNKEAVEWRSCAA